jgi:hypothetical protein
MSRKRRTNSRKPGSQKQRPSGTRVSIKTLRWTVVAALGSVLCAVVSLLGVLRPWDQGRNNLLPSCGTSAPGLVLAGNRVYDIKDGGVGISITSPTQPTDCAAGDRPAGTDACSSTWSATNESCRPQ